MSSGGVITVTMLDVLLPALREWLAERGLDAVQLPSEESDDDLPQYVVVIPESSPLEALLIERDL